MPFNDIAPRYSRTRSVRKAAVARTHTASLHPASVGGLNYVDSYVAMPPKDALILDNIIPRSFGCELRDGYLETCTDLPAIGESFLPFYGVNEAQSKLFLACQDGSIYDVTSPSPGPWVPSVAPATQVHPGRFTGVNFVTAGQHFLCIGGAGAGYLTYSVTDGWVTRVEGAGAGEVSFPVGSTMSIAEVDAVFTWKNQLILVRAASTEVYVLPVNQVAGAAALFDFGPLFHYGGEVAVFASWTVDGGDGLDDKLVIVSSQGDTLIYGGDGVTAENFAIAGRWYIGQVPVGRRMIMSYAGDVALLSERGMTYLTELLRGEGFSGAANVARKINPRLSKQVHETRGQDYWELRYVPSDRLILVNAPLLGVSIDKQYVMDVNNPAWCTFTGMEMRTCEVFFDHLYFSDSLKRVLRALDGETDGALSNGTPGTSITAELQTSFQPLNGEPYRLNQFIQAFVSFIAPAAPKVRAQINSDWAFASAPAVPGLATDTGARWDQAYWDQAVWTPESQTFKAWFGVEGLGYYASLRMNLAGVSGTSFISWGLVSQAGNIQ